MFSWDDPLKRYDLFTIPLVRRGKGGMWPVKLPYQILIVNLSWQQGIIVAKNDANLEFTLVYWMSSHWLTEWTPRSFSWLDIIQIYSAEKSKKACTQPFLPFTLSKGIFACHNPPPFVHTLRHFLGCEDILEPFHSQRGEIPRE